MKSSTATLIDKEEIYTSLKEGLQPIIKNIEVEKLTALEKENIKASLSNLERVALEIKAKIQNGK